MWGHSFRDRMAEQKLFRSRAIFMAAFIFALLSLLAGRMAYLQVVLHDKYQDLSENNRIFYRIIHPTTSSLLSEETLLLETKKEKYLFTILQLVTNQNKHI